MNVRRWLSCFLTVNICLVINVTQLYCDESRFFLENVHKKSMEGDPGEIDSKQPSKTQEYHWTFSSDCFPGWDTLDEGLQLGRFIGISSNNHEFEFVIARVDPSYYDFSLHMASQTGRAFSLHDWSRRYNLDLAINASMYLPDGFTSTGYLKNSDHINNGRIASKFGAFLVADPYNPQLPNAALLDRDTDNWKELIPQYKVVIQNYRIISADRKLLWRSKNITHSIAAVARDGEGRLLFIHTRHPMSDADFSKLLLALPIDVRVVMYVEGGSQAGLLLRSPAFTQLWIGKHPVDILDIDHTSSLVPNVIGLRRKK